VSEQQRDWVAWHAAYDQPDSGLARRLAMVQERIRVALSEAPPGPLRAVSLCAGQGRDLIGALADHPRREDVTARLVELDEHNAAFARQSAASAGLDKVEVVTGDAALTSQYAELVPADLVLMCGLFGNITDEAVQGMVGYAAQLTARGGTVVWTRGRVEPDLVPSICGWFGERGFEQVWLSDPDVVNAVGAHRLVADPVPLEPGARMFRFKPFVP
jgi:hypothetical protein